MNRVRHGYTLLEVLLATAIAALLMAALYAGMDIQLRAVQAGRESVDDSTLARSLFLNRFGPDIAGCLTPITATTTVAPISTDTIITEAVVPLNGGIIGDATSLTLWVSRVPKLAAGSADDAAMANSQPLSASDLVRISYWHTDSGLLRLELDRVTADESDSPRAPNIEDDPKYVIAPEVTELSFRYFDGTNWVDNWDGTAIGADGKTPLGPPRAVEVTLVLKRAGMAIEDPNATKRYVHIVGVNAANAQSTAAPEDATGTQNGTSTSPGTSSSGATTGGGTGP